MKAIIFNSGLGKRMGKFTENNHKSMVVLKNGETIFERQLRILSECGIDEFVITTGPFEEQLKKVSEKFPNLKFTFVHNPVYDKTNYIYSMFLAKEYIKGNCLLLHGDLVFNKELVQEILADPRESICLIDKTKKLPEKDFKGRVIDGKLQEVSVEIFDENCFAFQPLYKLSSDVVNAWCEKVEEFVQNGNTGVYADNALNTILPTLTPGIFTKSYSEHYIDEIDTSDDYVRVSEEIENYEKNGKVKKQKEGRIK